MSAGNNSSFYIISTSLQDVHMWRAMLYYNSCPDHLAKSAALCFSVTNAHTHLIMLSAKQTQVTGSRSISTSPIPHLSLILFWEHCCPISPQSLDVPSGSLHYVTLSSVSDLPQLCPPPSMSSSCQWGPITIACFSLSGVCDVWLCLV